MVELAMSAPGSITHWLGKLKEGVGVAAQPIWERYCHQLVLRARQRLTTAPNRVADEEDVALCAFTSFCRAVEQNRFPQLNDRDDLWQLLIVLCDRKAHDLVKSERRLRRGGGRVLDEAALADQVGEEFALAEIAALEPTPEFSAQIADECRRLLGVLDNAELRWIALRKMEGFTVAEIAEQLGCVPRTIKRRLQVIRRIWQEDGGT
jgi:DNA-directed RNA polymerase specialized sigma24 family protein